MVTSCTLIRLYQDLKAGGMPEQQVIEVLNMLVSNFVDKEELEKAGKDLSEVIMPIGSKLYEAAKDEKPADDKAEATDETKSDEPIEGEVVDEDKPKDKK